MSTVALGITGTLGLGFAIGRAFNISQPLGSQHK